MINYHKIASFLVAAAIAFPLCHFETICIHQNGRKSAVKIVLKLRTNTGYSIIKFLKKNTSTDDADFCLVGFSNVFSNYYSQTVPIDSLKFSPASCKYAVWSKATFS